MQQHPGSSRINGSGYPLSLPAVAHPPPRFQGVRRGIKPPKCPTRHLFNISLKDVICNGIFEYVEYYRLAIYICFLSLVAIYGGEEEIYF